ncbi:hypothetical protein [Schlesneria sp. T3-172]|uniref:hypothetical protein n=1 Tax=Schlesneria TaxID=656899 RepID=UPI002EE73DFE
MASAANKPGPVHYFLVAFVVSSVVLGITTYMFHRDASDKYAEVAKLNDENQKLNRAQKTRDDEVLALKNKIGIKLDQVEDPNNPENKATVIKGLDSELQVNGLDAQGPTVVETLRKMRDALNATTADRDSKVAKINALEKEILALKGQYQGQVDNYGQQTKDAERDKLAVISDRDERVIAKDREIAAIKANLNATSVELTQEKESREKERKELNDLIASLGARIDFFKEKIDELEKLSFEDVDGMIRRVEHDTGTVWINVGEADNLKPRMTFSVYSKDNLGVGRGAEDIKGKIEVTRLLGPHMAEAKVIDEDLYRPMVAGDLIYTPIWSPGLVEKISLIGTFDLDGDGRSDREELHRMMASAGCIIDNEIDDDGNRIPEDGKITVHTRFLVKGDILELPNAVGAAEEAKATRLQNHLKDMVQEARANGVRVIKMNDFLAYIGYHSKRRTFLPGQPGNKWNLKAGSASESTKDVTGDRTSSGNVSGSYSKLRQAPQQQSDGNTSKVFGGSGR